MKISIDCNVYTGNRGITETRREREGRQDKATDKRNRESRLARCCTSSIPRTIIVHIYHYRIFLPQNASPSTKTNPQLSLGIIYLTTPDPAALKAPHTKPNSYVQPRKSHFRRNRQNYPPHPPFLILQRRPVSNIPFLDPLQSPHPITTPKPPTESAAPPLLIARQQSDLHTDRFPTSQRITHRLLEGFRGGGRRRGVL